MDELEAGGNIGNISKNRYAPPNLRFSMLNSYLSQKAYDMKEFLRYHLMPAETVILYKRMFSGTFGYHHLRDAKDSDIAESKLVEMASIVSNVTFIKIPSSKLDDALLVLKGYDYANALISQVCGAIEEKVGTA